MGNFNGLRNGQPGMISISDFQEGKINQVGVENIDGQTIKKKA
jgi:hypothetical protein